MSYLKRWMPLMLLLVLLMQSCLAEALPEMGLPDQPVKFLKLRPVGYILQDLKIRIFDLRCKEPEIGIDAALGIGCFLTEVFP